MPNEITDQDANQLLRMAAGYAAWCAGMCDDEMMSLLNQAAEHLRIELAPKFGPDAANAIADAFPEAVISARRELEADASRVVN
jgi:acetylornithine/succinyldiaminopimelate/putrescine aminotransferase